jgi:multimeric flavodoxin WrbA
MCGTPVLPVLGIEPNNWGQPFGDCFPWDPMQELYPLVLKSDVMLCSTGVNQSAMSTRLKTFLDRLISLDGGFFVGPDQFGNCFQSSAERESIDKLFTVL